MCGAQWGQQDPQRHARRNRYRYRPLDTRVGTIDVAIPKLRSGTYFPEWLLQRRKRCESALITVVARCYLALPSALGSPTSEHMRRGRLSAATRRILIIRFIAR